MRFTYIVVGIIIVASSTIYAAPRIPITLHSTESPLTKCSKCQEKIDRDDAIAAQKMDIALQQFANFLAHSAQAGQTLQGNDPQKTTVAIQQGALAIQSLAHLVMQLSKNRMSTYMPPVASDPALPK